MANQATLLGFSEVLSSLGDGTFLGLSVLPGQIRGIDMGHGRAWLCSVGPGGTCPAGPEVKTGGVASRYSGEQKR